MDCNRMTSEPKDRIACLQKTQDSFEQRFNCIVCMEAKLKMVYGCCQHRLCADCLYTKKGFLRLTMTKCPICMMPNSFPFHRPEIPEDNIEIQKCLGVRLCPNKNRGCPVEMWIWEVEEHVSVCSHKEISISNTSCKNASKDNSQGQKCPVRERTKGKKILKTNQKPYMLRSTGTPRNR